jgi:hypothetical protein
MNVVECDAPLQSVLDRHVVEAAYFRDSYRAPLSCPHAKVTDIFQAIFAHHPTWMKIGLMTRNRIVRLFGLETVSDAEILNFMPRSSYRVGDRIGVWPIFALTENELVAGRDNKHLDFRLSVLRVMENETASVVVTTICTVHNLFGKLYLFFVAPFHKWGVKLIISNAVAAGRL